jgi:hypothetical protein
MSTCLDCKALLEEHRREKAAKKAKRQYRCNTCLEGRARVEKVGAPFAGKSKKRVPDEMFPGDFSEESLNNMRQHSSEHKAALPPVFTDISEASRDSINERATQTEQENGQVDVTSHKDEIQQTDEHDFDLSTKYGSVNFKFPESKQKLFTHKQSPGSYYVALDKKGERTPFTIIVENHSSKPINATVKYQNEELGTFRVDPEGQYIELTESPDGAVVLQLDTSNTDRENNGLVEIVVKMVETAYSKKQKAGNAVPSFYETKSQQFVETRAGVPIDEQAYQVWFRVIEREGNTSDPVTQAEVQSEPGVQVITAYPPPLEF